MAGYAAMLHIDRASPRLRANGHARVAADQASGEVPVVSDRAAHRGTVLEDVGREPASGRIADLWADVREVWGQAMYVLNDPGGWR